MLEGRNKTELASNVMSYDRRVPLQRREKRGKGAATEDCSVLGVRILKVTHLSSHLHGHITFTGPLKNLISYKNTFSV